MSGLVGSSETECRRAADALLGQALAGVTYVGLSYEARPEVEWDFGDWHWPEVGVELQTTSGDRFFSIWDSKVTNFELAFVTVLSTASGCRSRKSRAVRGHGRDAARWAPLIGHAVKTYELALSAPDDPPVLAPVGIRLTIGPGVVWIVAAAPRDAAHATENLYAEDVHLRHDEVIVVFGDERARLLGIPLAA